jgi:Leucine-rich repeat (LRR) protein
LDLSQCALTTLPEKWHLPKLTKLNLSQNRFTDFPEEVSMMLGLFGSLSILVCLFGNLTVSCFFFRVEYVGRSA